MSRELNLEDPDDLREYFDTVCEITGYRHGEIFLVEYEEDSSRNHFYLTEKLPELLQFFQTVGIQVKIYGSF